MKSRRKENKKIVMRYYETLLGKGRKMEKVRAFGSVNSFTLIGPWILQNPDELFLLSRNTACTLRQLALLSLTSKWTQINTNFFFSFSLFCSFSFYIFSFSFFFSFLVKPRPRTSTQFFPFEGGLQKRDISCVRLAPIDTNSTILSCPPYTTISDFYRDFVLFKKNPIRVYLWVRCNLITHMSNNKWNHIGHRLILQPFVFSFAFFPTFFFHFFVHFFSLLLS